MSTKGDEQSKKNAVGIKSVNRSGGGTQESGQSFFFVCRKKN